MMIFVFDVQHVYAFALPVFSAFVTVHQISLKCSIKHALSEKNPTYTIDLRVLGCD